MRPTVARRPARRLELTMDLWMYLVVIGMFTIAIVGTVWITLWTIQRGERARAERPGGASPARPEPSTPADEPEQQAE